VVIDEASNDAGERNDELVALVKLLSSGIPTPPTSFFRKMLDDDDMEMMRTCARMAKAFGHGECRCIRQLAGLVSALGFRFSNR
jgi:hypothetical protein